MNNELEKIEHNISNDLGAFGSHTLEVINTKVSELRRQAGRMYDLQMKTKTAIEVRAISTH